MKPFQHTTNNSVLAPPPGIGIEECVALPITRIVYPDGAMATRSFLDANSGRACRAERRTTSVLRDFPANACTHLARRIRRVDGDHHATGVTVRKKPPHYIDGRAPFVPCRTCNDDYGFEISLIRERLYTANPSWSVARALDRARIEHAKGVRS